MTDHSSAVSEWREHGSKVSYPIGSPAQEQYKIADDGSTTDYIETAAGEACFLTRIGQVFDVSRNEVRLSLPHTSEAIPELNVYRGRFGIHYNDAIDAEGQMGQSDDSSILKLFSFLQDFDADALLWDNRNDSMASLDAMERARKQLGISCVSDDVAILTVGDMKALADAAAGPPKRVTRR